MFNKLKFKIKERLKQYLRSYSRISFSQNGEDLQLLSLFKEGLKCKSIRYLDVGAHHPKYFSNTYLFYKLRYGRGVLVEPDAYLCKYMAKARPRDVVLNVGVGVNNVEEEKDFYIMTSRTLNTFSKEMAEDYQHLPNFFGKQKIEEVQKVKLVPVNQIIQKYFPEGLDFLSLDIEGLDYLVLSSIDFNSIRPKCICVETATVKNQEVVYSSETDEISIFLKEKGYFVYSRNLINTIFVDGEVLKRLQCKID